MFAAVAAVSDMGGRREYFGPIVGRPSDPGRRRGSLRRLAIMARSMRLALRPRLPQWVCVHVLPRLFGNARPPLKRARFAVGDRIWVRPEQALGHTRQPGYVTGKPGVITAHLGATLFPDAHAVRRRMRPQHLYTVAFDGRELWGEQAEPQTEVRIDLYEPYLEPS